MKLYRYEFSDKNKRVGILVGLDDYFDEEEIWDLSAIFEDELKAPDIEMLGTKSYFTEKGNRKFKKSIRRIHKAAKEKGIDVINIVKDISEIGNIVYSDNYQVVVGE